MAVVYRDRHDAGRQLARLLASYAGQDPIVLGLPRGGVIVAWEIASALRALLDVWLVRKLPAPENPEVGIGAVAEDGTVLVDERLVGWLEIPRRDVQWVIEREAGELLLRRQRYRGERGPPSVSGRTVILVDDGIATGSTARAAIASLREAGPKQLVLAAPVGIHEVIEALRPRVDALVCPHTPSHFRSVSQFFEQFDPVSDDEVLALLRRPAAAVDAPPLSAFGAARRGRSTVQVWSGGVALEAVLEVPQTARGLILVPTFPTARPQHVDDEAIAAELGHAGFATLRVELIAAEERATANRDPSVFHGIEFLTRRILGIVAWLAGEPLLSGLPLGVFASGEAGLAAVRAATEGLDVPLRALVVRDCPLGADEPVLEQVHTPVLAIVSLGADEALLEDARMIERIPAEHALVTVEAIGAPSAALTAEFARDWFVRQLPSAVTELRA